MFGSSMYITMPLKPIKPYSALLVISHCALRRKDSLCALARWFCVSRKGGTGGGGWGHPQGAVHMVAARLGVEKAMVGSGRATPRPDCMDRLRKHYSHFAEGCFLARKAAWSLSGCMATDSADYYMLVSEWVCSQSRYCLLKASFEVRSWMEMEIRCIKGMCGLKVVRSEKNLGSKGF